MRGLGHLRGRRRRRRWLLLAPPVTAAAIVGAALSVVGQADAPDPGPTASAPQAAPAQPAAPPRPTPPVMDSFHLAEPAEPRAARVTHPVTPAEIRVPAIGVSSRVVDLGLNPDGTLEVPSEFDITGWWTGGAKPGEPGSAVIAGHVDSETGPAVFYRLHELTPGDRIHIADRDGATLTFVVESLDEYAKDDFPTDKVYRGGLWPNLRLITCGGSFDRATGHYRANLVVYAKLVGGSP